MSATSAPLTGVHAVESLVDWWTLAGVDAVVGDSPRNWLAADQRPAIAPSLPGQPAPAVPAPAQMAMPDSMDGFIEWLAQGSDLPEARFPGGRILPRTVTGARLLVITDMPTDEDMAAGRLLSGADGVLVAAMLRAVGLEEAEVSIASLLVTRPAGGMCEERIWSEAAARMRHYIALGAPGGLLLFGDQTTRALGGMDSSPAAEPSGNVNHAKPMIPSMRFPAPYILMRYPARKAAAWADLRTLAVRP
jgi:uracil-DNA glycosylase